MARSAVGRVKMELFNNVNKAFNEYPFYTKANYLDDAQTTQSDAQNFQNALASLTSNLTTNTLSAVKIEYSVDLSTIS